MKVLFLPGAGKTKLLNTLIESQVSIVAVVVPKSRKYFPKYQELISIAAQNNVRIICAPPKNLHELTNDVEFDVLLSCGYPFVIPEEVFSRAKCAVNFHPALLPKHRGRYLHYILIHKDEHSGVTAHLIDSTLDTGPIIKQEHFKVSPFDTIKSLARKSADAEIKLVADVLELIKNGAVEALPQKEEHATSYFKQRTPEDSEVDPDKPLKELFYEIRSCDPVEYPAFFYMEGHKVYIHLYRKEKPEDEFDMV